MRQGRSRPISRIEVRESVRGRELCVDGTFASLWRPGRVTTGSVWDALAAPLLSLPPERRGSILLLGLGGGSAARLARALLPHARIVGVERDPHVLEAAREHFQLDALLLEVVLADAKSYLARGREKFDAVLEDVFVGSGRKVRKPDWLPEPGLALAARRLRPGGLLATNSLDEAAGAARALCTHVGPPISIEVDGYDNRILAAGPAGLRAKWLRAAVAAHPILAATLPKLRFRTLPS
ncbi:MAG TPA: methyltransferase domain-containing protein [Myxococcota bacterium]|nr:methyltransferase domain-containing protein [Myxococcota bacterium]